MINNTLSYDMLCNILRYVTLYNMLCLCYDMLYNMLCYMTCSVTCYGI